MRRINKKLQKIKVTEDDFKDFSRIVSIPKNLNKSMVSYITTWQEKPDDPQQTDTMTTKPEWFKEFEEKQEKRWKEQRKFNEKQEKRWEKQEKFNERILVLVESLVQRIENIEKRLDVIEKRVENIEHRLDKLESRINNLVIKNNLRE